MGFWSLHSGPDPPSSGKPLEPAFGTRSSLFWSETGENVVNATVVEALSNLPDKTVNSASCRWAVCVGEAGKLELQLQSLPCLANLLAGKPIYKRYIK